MQAVNWGSVVCLPPLLAVIPAPGQRIGFSAVPLARSSRIQQAFGWLTGEGISEVRVAMAGVTERLGAQLSATQH